MSAFVVGFGVFGLAICLPIIALAPRAIREAEAEKNAEAVKEMKSTRAGVLFAAVVFLAMILGALAARSLA